MAKHSKSLFAQFSSNSGLELSLEASIVNVKTEVSKEEENCSEEVGATENSIKLKENRSIFGRSTLSSFKTIEFLEFSSRDSTPVSSRRTREDLKIGEENPIEQQTTQCDESNKTNDKSQSDSTNAQVIQGESLEKASEVKESLETRTISTEEFKKPILKTRTSAKNLFANKKPQEFQEDALPEYKATSLAKPNLLDASPEKNDAGVGDKATGLSETVDNLERSTDLKVEIHIPLPSGDESTKNRSPPKKPGRFDDDWTASPSTRKFSEEGEKKLREELEFSNRYIEILDMIINFADKPRDIGGMPSSFISY